MNFYGNCFSHFSVKKAVLCLVCIILYLSFAKTAYSVACTPVSANICVGSDDLSFVYINGHLIDDGTNFSGVHDPADIPCAPVDVSFFNLSGNNVIAVRNYNSIAGFVWSSWSLDITCFDGSHTYIESNDGDVTFFNQPTSSDPTPANDAGGLTWTDPDYSPVPAWIAPVNVTYTAAFWYMPAVTHPTGVTMVPISYNSWAGNNPGNPDQSPIGQALFFRQEFSFMAPIGITKTINKTTFYLNETVTYCFNYSNPEATARTFSLWDTIPAVTDFINCTGGCTTATYGSDVVASWSITVPAGGSGTVCMWVGANRYPRLENKGSIFAMFDTESIFAAEFRKEKFSP